VETDNLEQEMKETSGGLVRKVADYCWSNNFLGFLSPLIDLFPLFDLSFFTCFLIDVFRKFFKDHALEFADAPPLIQGGEHNLVYYSLFQVFCSSDPFISSSLGVSRDL
jgi:hypothetical protein